MLPNKMHEFKNLGKIAVLFGFFHGVMNSIVVMDYIEQKHNLCLSLRVSDVAGLCAR